MSIEPLLPPLIVAEPPGPGWDIPLVSVDDFEALDLETLSPAEFEIMRWLADGKTNVQIAQLRGRSPATVRNQLHHVYRKLGARTRGEAVAIWRSARGPEGQAPLHPTPSINPPEGNP